MDPNKRCSICLEESSGCHFGAEACRACAAFFRRSVTQNKRYHCRGNNDCDVSANIRCMCRACRYSKCLSMGMNPVGVQQRPENIRRRISEEPSTSSQTPILTRIKTNYQKMLNARLVVYKKEGQSLFEERAPRPINYKESVEQGVKDVSLVADWIAWCFDGFVDLPMDQKNILFRNFYTKFCQLEVTFTSYLSNKPNSIVLPSGDYIDMENLDQFYYDEEAEKHMEKEEIERLFNPYYQMQQKCLIRPMTSLKIDDFEFFTLVTFLLWDTGIEGQSEECSRIGDQIKESIIKELAFYLKNLKKIEEPSVRIALIVGLLPAVERCVRKFQDDMEMTQFFNIYKSSREFYDLVNGNFC
ncbi:unnamed protein product [Caenorhabditis brenneri]